MTFGLFAPLPLPVMIPFMGYQSLVMGEAFGLSYQYAKRKISSMTNEEFNKLTIQEVQQMLKKDIQTAIPQMKASMDDMLTLQTQMIDHVLDAIKQLPADVYNSLFGGAVQQQGEATGTLPAGVASFIRPILEPGIGGLKHSTARIIPEPVIALDQGHDVGLTAGDTVDTTNVEKPDLQWEHEQRRREFDYLLKNREYKLELEKAGQPVKNLPVPPAQWDTAFRQIKMPINIPPSVPRGKIKPSDPRGIIAKRNELIAYIDQESKKLKKLASNDNTVGTVAKRNMFNIHIRDAQAELTKLLQTYNI